MASLSLKASGAAREAIEAHLPQLAAERIASRISAKDATLWGSEAEAEAGIRLGWVDISATSRPLVAAILALRDELRAEGVRHIVLAGMGGSSLAPEVITRTAGVELTVLDSTDPDQVRNAVTDRLAETAIVVSSKSGSTVETDSQRRVFEQAFTEAGIDAAGRIIIVTDPGSPLDEAARASGYRAVFNADPHVGGRYSALTAFGLVPSGLAGVDIVQLLDDAEEALEMLADDAEDNIGLRLGAAIGGTNPLRDKLLMIDEGCGIPGFADWAEQLLAESTGKLGTGVLPVVAGPDAPEVASGADDVLVVRLAHPDSEAEPDGHEVTVSGSLGSQLVVWEFATVVAGRLLGINPFDQPDVEAAKKAARGLLDARPEQGAPDLIEGVVEIRGDEELLAGAAGLADAVQALIRTLGPRGYLSIQAYLDRVTYAALEEIRNPLAAASGRPVTFGWGPRFLHSTGQFHKGGPDVGCYLQITAAPSDDLAIPDRPFTFGELIAAQAAGDAQVLSDHGRPVLRLHLTDRAVGVGQLVHAIQFIAGGPAISGK